MLMKNIPGYEGYAATEDGQIWSYKTNKFLSINTYGFGYPEVVLCVNGKRKTVRVHKLVARAFIPNPENLPQIDHIDEDKSNCSVENLRWITSRENVQRSVYKRNSTGAKKKPVRCVETGEVYESQSAAARAMGVCPIVISCCIRGQQNTAAGYHWESVEVK